MCLVKVLLQVDVGDVSLGLFGSSGLGSLGLDGSSSDSMSISVSLGKNFFLLGSEWVHFVHHSGVGEWVLLGLVVSSDGRSDSSQTFLNLIGVDDS